MKLVPNGYFLLMVNFLLKVTNFSRTSFHLLQDYLCFICNGRETERECVTERKKERGNYLIEENFFREILKVFFKILSLFPYEMFFWPKLFIPDERISLPKILPNKHDLRRHIDLCKKSFKNDIRIEIRIKMHFNYCFTV